ncbi:hypothetical protein PCANB_001752 [Pneumocystis canis]|nr:hypothetical protein PCANB_001752 [Pneumocystis canis]
MTLSEDKDFNLIKLNFKDISIDLNGISTSDFLLASESFLNIIGKDNGNIKKIRDYMQKYPLECETLESLIKAEAMQKKTTTTEGLLWLIRSFEFTSNALHRSMENETEELSISFSKAYDMTLKKHHSFFIRSIFTMAMKKCPNRNNFYSKICPDSERLRTFINEWLSGLDKIIIYLQNFYESGHYAQVVGKITMNHNISNSEVYSAVYSGVPVYEMICQGISVMRRRSNSYLNATQILKVAGIDKGKRTKILEKEILIGEHEKVQGGYGKYQGTWIPFERGVEFCRQYGVEQMLWPILSLDLSMDNQNNNTPTKEQALAFRRKQSLDSLDNKKDVPLKLKPSYATYPSSSSSMTNFNKPKALSPKHSDYVLMELHNNIPNYNSTICSNNPILTLNNSKTNNNENVEESSKKHSEYFHGLPNNIVSPSIARKQYPVFTNMDLRMDNKPSQPLDQKNTRNFHRSRDILTSIFLDSDIQSVPSVLTNASPEDGLDIDVPIDDLGHTALHWASALARLPLVASLIFKGADPCRSNFSGETSLIRAVLVTNNLDQSTFPELLEYIYPAIPLIDHQGRTVLHHIALTAGIKGRSSASRYYLETLLEWIVKGSESGKSGLTLSSFVAKVVDAQDKNGDTALNIAARIGNKSIIQQLLDIGADATLPNKAGLRPLDFGITGEIPLSFYVSQNQSLVIPETVAQKSQDIFESIKTMIIMLGEEFYNEMHKKQALIDIVHGQLREATRTLAELRKDLENSRKRASYLADIQQKCKNIERVINEETLYFYKHYSDSSFKTKDGLNTISDVVDEKIDPDAPFFVDISLAGVENEDSPSFISISVLSARIAAYQKNAKVLCALATSLRGRSSELEDKCRKVVSLCTGVEENKVDSLLEGLLQAVESDNHQGVDMVRLSGFLKLINEDRHGTKIN